MTDLKVGEKVKVIGGAKHGHKGTVVELRTLWSVAIVDFGFKIVPGNTKVPLPFTYLRKVQGEDQAMSDGHLKIGDQVRVSGDLSKAEGLVGRVCWFEGPGVLLDLGPSFSGHTGVNTAEEGNCWWVLQEHTVRLNEEVEAMNDEQLYPGDLVTIELEGDASWRSDVFALVGMDGRKVAVLNLTDTAFPDKRFRVFDRDKVTVRHAPEMMLYTVVGGGRR